MTTLAERQAIRRAKQARQTLLNRRTPDIEIEYRSHLVAIVQELRKLAKSWVDGRTNRKSIDGKINALIRGVPLEQLYQKQARYTSSEVKTRIRKLMPKKAPAKVRDALDGYLRRIIVQDARDPEISLFIRRNVQLIKNMSDEMLDKVATILEENPGARWEVLAPKIYEVTDVTTSRSELIARDQTLSLNSNLTEKQHKDLGITEYIWTATREPGRTRQWHLDLDGKTIKYSDPPVGGGTGKKDRGHAGSGINCRCQQTPVVPLFEGLDV